MIREGDAAIGLFIEKLKSLGVFQNTLIVFTSDNGAAIGPASSWSESLYHDAKDNSSYGGNRIEVDEENHGSVHKNAQGVARDGSPLRGEKGFVYEGGHQSATLGVLESEDTGRTENSKSDHRSP